MKNTLLKSEFALAEILKAYDEPKQRDLHIQLALSALSDVIDVLRRINEEYEQTADALGSVLQKEGSLSDLIRRSIRDCRDEGIEEYILINLLSFIAEMENADEGCKNE
ncbi:MAG: hypothetical protein OCU22_03615 [Canidatus Methanoxibalbensis ujae]|nr:hypothetical protein [Candidatus Methanoxibalbensis ujae]